MIAREAAACRDIFLHFRTWLSPNIKKAELSAVDDGGLIHAWVNAPPDWAWEIDRPLPWSR